MKSTLSPWISSIRLQLRADAGDIVVARVGSTLALRILAPGQPTTDVVWRNEVVEDARGRVTHQALELLGPFLVEAAILTAGWDLFTHQRGSSKSEIVLAPGSPLQSFRVRTRTAEDERPHSFTIEPPGEEVITLQPIETATVASIASFSTKWLRNKSEIISFQSIEINRPSAARELQRWEPRSSMMRGSLTGIDTSA